MSRKCGETCGMAAFQPPPPCLMFAPVQRASFVKNFRDRLGQRAMKSGEWKTYRTRFLVKAKQLNSSLSFVDALGREHSGRRGDYLVESSDGVISIAPQRIFEDIYVAMLHETQPAAERPAPRKQPQACRDRRGASSVGMM